MTNSPLKCLVFLTIIFAQISSHAWGGRGHNTICEAACFLVKNKDLKSFLQMRPHMMGHICNIPDIQWKNIGAEVRASGDPTHQVDPEILGYTMQTLPLDLDKLKKDFTGKPSQFDKEKIVQSVPRQLGTLWWRVDQLMNLLAQMKEDFSHASAPKNWGEEQDNDSLYNKTTYAFMTTAGILGHFVGDAGQPYHNTANHDGYANGHGGIHYYYEEAVVAEIDGELLSKILKKARAMNQPDWLKGTYLERMKKFSIVAADDVKKVEKLDVLSEKSSIKTEHGKQVKVTAVRKTPEETYKKFEPLIVTEMARSAYLLAHLWDEAYEAAGKPKLSAYRSFKYPFNVDFIAPSYDDTPAAPAVTK